MDTENPVVALDPSGSLSTDVEALSPSLPSASVATMERLLLARESETIAKIEAMHTQLKAELLTPARSSARSVLAQLAALGPANFHQCTVFYSTTDHPEDQHMKERAPVLLVASAAMVLMQCMATIGGILGTMVPVCASNDFCHAGMWCNFFRGGSARCTFCGDVLPLPLQWEGSCEFKSFYDPATPFPDQVGQFSILSPLCSTFNNHRDPNFVGYNLSLASEVCTTEWQGKRMGLDTGAAVDYLWTNAPAAAWCDACRKADGTINSLTADRMVDANIDSSGIFDRVTLIFASCIVAFQIVGELMDIQLCSLAILRAADKLSARWRFALMLVGGVRRWFFLPSLVISVPTLVMWRGGDALNVCFNTIALLFLCEIDNVAFALGLSSRVRTRLHEVGRIELSAHEEARLERSKAAHGCVLVSVMLAAVWFKWSKGFPVIFAAFWLGGVFEAASVGSWQQFGEVTAASLLGLASFVVVMIFGASIN